MEQIADLEMLKNSTYLGGKAWTAYVGMAMVTLFMLAGCGTLVWFNGSQWGWLVVIAILLTFLYVAYESLLISSYGLYYNDLGVWRKHGNLPWNRGLAGVKWRDLDEAIFYQDIWSWFTKSYAIKIGHRFTKESEIYLTHIKYGNEIVKKINMIHRDMIRRGMVQ